MNRKFQPMRHRQTGFSIVELMIAGVLGLLLIAGVIQLFLGSNQNYSMQDELASIQEDGRFALMFLNQQIEMSGWTDENAVRVLSAVDFNNSADGANYDTIAVTSVKAIGVEGAAGTENYDCNNSYVGSGEVTNIFSVNAAGDLMCRGLTSGTAQPLIKGVESFQVLYGVETERVCPDGAVDRYMTRSEVDAAGLVNNVISVRIGLLLKSSRDLLPSAKEQTYQVLDSPLVLTDKRVRRLFQETIFMPNSAFNLLVNSTSAVDCMSGF